MIKIKSRIKAVYSNYTKFIESLKSLSKKNDLDIEIFSPMPLHDVDKLFPQKPSGVRWFTFIGGMLGLAVGFGFPIYTVLQWPLITGGKPIVTVQTFVIIAFELLILFGAIFTLLGLLFHAKIPRQNLSNYDKRFSENSFGVILKAEDSEVNELKNILKGADDLVVDRVEVEE
jgi:hypothetical protein